MATEQELKNNNPNHKEFQNLLDKDFKDSKLKENEIIKATVTEITKNFVVVDCKAKMEGMIPVEEFKNDDEINFKEILFVLWGSKILIAICIFCFAIGSVYYSLSIANKFSSSLNIKLCSFCNYECSSVQCN